jgi:hypothetical protein
MSFKKKIDPNGSLVLSIILHDVMVESLDAERRKRNGIMALLRLKKWKRRARISGKL